MARCLVLAARRLGGGGRGDKGSCDGRLFEATEIATMDDEMLMEETLDNSGRTSLAAQGQVHEHCVAGALGEGEAWGSNSLKIIVGLL